MKDNEWGIIAIGIAILLALTGIGLGIGLAIAIAKGSIVLSLPWVVPVSTVAGTGALVVGVTTIVVKVYKEAAKKPFYWLMPVVSIVAGLVVDFCKELYDGDGDGRLIKACFAAVILLLFLAGGMLWKQGYKPLRVLGSVFFVLPLVLVLLKYAQVNHKTFWQAIQSISLGSSLFASLMVLLLMCGACSLLCYYLRED